MIDALESHLVIISDSYLKKVTIDRLVLLINNFASGRQSYRFRTRTRTVTPKTTFDDL